MSQTVLWFFGFPLVYVLYFVLTLFVPSFGSSAIASLMESIVLEVLLLISFLIVTKFLLKKNYTDFFTLKPLKPSAFKTGIFLKGFFIMLITGTLTTLVWKFFDRDNFEFTFKSEGAVGIWLVTLVLLIIASVNEELLFRGYIGNFSGMNRPVTWQGKIFICVISGVLFSAAHFMNPETEGNFALWYMTDIFIFGFSFMLFFLQTGRLEFPLGVHLANNMVSAYLCGYDNSVVGTNPLFTQHNMNGFLLIIQSVLCMIACALALKSDTE